MPLGTAKSTVAPPVESAIKAATGDRRMAPRRGFRCFVSHYGTFRQKPIGAGAREYEMRQC